jgi:protein involved in polysaccharide export with SLBB domain
MSKSMMSRFLANILLAWCLILSSIMLIVASANAEDLSATDFTLAPGDIVKLDILDDDKEPMDLPIAMDGSIQAPFLGAVPIAGLTVSQALDALNRRYVEQRIFVVPKLGFSVASYRPIFVVGDVRTPGSYPFQPLLTVEKAMGLAGGQITTNPAEDPVLARARLRGELEAIEGNIIREALAYARLTAELAERADILPEDIPTTARDYVNGPLAESVREVEGRIAKANTEGFSAQRTVLSEQIAEAEQQMVLLNQLLENVNGTIEIGKGDVARAQELRKRGINTQSDVSNVQRELSQTEARQLEVLTNLSQARRDMGLLKSRLVEISQTRHVGALVDLQTHNVALAGFLATHRTTEEQLILMSSLTEAELAKNKQVVLDFTIRRGAGASMVDIPATATSVLSPGDVLAVRIHSSDDAATVAAVPAAQP